MHIIIYGDSMDDVKEFKELRKTVAKVSRKQEENKRHTRSRGVWKAYPANVKLARFMFLCLFLSHTTRARTSKFVQRSL